ncbi:MAG: YfhO family protein [Clostridia bacterium]|nr:YfhO family protein [Clostridia bacterium]
MEKEKQTVLTVERAGKQNFRERISAFFDRNYALIFASLIVLAMYTAALFQEKVYPFGKKYTVASYDLSAQICPFIEHLFDVFQGKSTLTYSYAIMGGADVTGTFLYFFISPFSFLFLIFGDGMVAQASVVVMACKLMTIAVAGTWFAKKLFQGIPDYLCVAVGVVYTYCGYTFVANTYINWMDFLFYLPFCVGAFKRFVQTGKFLPFSILIACCIYTCFSIACFSMFTVFPILIAYALFCVKKQDRNRFISKLCVSFVVAILLALPVLLPALSAYTNSARGGALFENFWYGFSYPKGAESIGEFSSSAFTEHFTQALYAKWSYILADSVFFILTIVWFFRRGLRDPFAKFMLIAGVFVLLPNVVDEAMLLMNMGSYMSYALRFGFLTSLYFLGGACLALEGLCYKPAHSFEGTRLFALPKFLTSKKKSEEQQTLSPETESLGGVGQCWSKREQSAKIMSVLLIVVGIIAAIFLGVYTSYEWYVDFLSNFTKDSDTLASLESFSPRFAHSLGGLEVIIVVFIVVFIVAGLGCYFVSIRKVSPRLTSIVLMVVVGIQVLFFNNQLVIGNLSTQHVALGNYQTISAQLNAMDDGYFRVKDYSDRLTANAPFTGNTNSFSVFSSVIDEDNFATYHLFGFAGNGKNTFKSAHNPDKQNRNEAFGDSFMGYKYFFIPKEKKETFDDVGYGSYMKPVMVMGADGKEIQLSDGDYCVYENTLVFPLGYTVKDANIRFSEPNENNSLYRKRNQQKLYEYLRGKTLVEMESLDLVDSRELVTVKATRELSEYLWTRSADVKVGKGRITASVTASAGEYLFLNFVASDGYQVTINGKKASLVENDLRFLAVELEEGENVVEFTYSSPYVKWMGVGIGGALVGLCAVWLVLKKTKLLEKCSGVIAWSGILLAIGVVGFFMIFPTSVCLVKVFHLIIP